MLKIIETNNQNFIAISSTMKNANVYLNLFFVFVNVVKKILNYLNLKK